MEYHDGNIIKKRLLVDTVTATSPGIQQIISDLFPFVAKHCPDGWEVVLIGTAGERSRIVSEKVVVITVDHPGNNWIGRWKWYNRVLPAIVRQYQANVIYSL